jgi:hypothetical protein
MPDVLHETGPFAGHSPEQERPLGGYGALMSLYLALTALFGLWLHRSGRELPERVEPADLALVAAATHKAARIVTKDRVASTVRAPFTEYQDDSGGPGEVNEAARGTGLRRAVGELLVCPYCIGLWIATALLAGLIVAPRPTRWIASALVAVFGAEILQIAYVKAESSR